MNLDKDIDTEINKLFCLTEQVNNSLVNSNNKINNIENININNKITIEKSKKKIISLTRSFSKIKSFFMSSDNQINNNNLNKNSANDNVNNSDYKENDHNLNKKDKNLENKLDIILNSCNHQKDLIIEGNTNLDKVVDLTDDNTDNVNRNISKIKNYLR